MSPSRPSTATFVIPALLLLGTAPRMFGLDDESFWHDEAWTWGLIRDGPGALFHRLCHADAHPPLYYLLVQGWSALAGTSEVALRMFSVILGILTLPFFLRLATRVAGLKAGLVAAFLLAISPSHVYFSQEARSYAFLFLLAVVSLDLLFDLRAARHTGKWIAFALVTAAVVYTHYMGAFLVLAEAAMVILLRRDRPGFLREFALAGAGAFALFLPWLPTFFSHTGSVARDFWIPPLSPKRLFESLCELTHHSYNPGYLLRTLVVAPLYLAAFAAPFLTRKREHRALLLLLLVPAAGEALVSLALPVFYARTFLYATGALLVLAAAGALALPRRAAPAAVLVLAGTFVPCLIWLLAFPEKEDWRVAARRLDHRAGPDDLVVAVPGHAATSLDYYAARPLSSSRWADRIRRVGTASITGPVTTAEAVRAEVERAPAVWLVLRWGKDEGWLAHLERAFERRSSWSSHGAELHHFVRRAP